MAVTNKEIQALQGKAKQYKVSCGESMFVLVKPGGGKTYRGRVGGKDLYVGCASELKLKDAKELWRQKKAAAQSSETCGHTVGELCERFLAAGQWKPTTRTDYTNKINADILPILGAKTDLKDLEWENGGRTKVMDLRQIIIERGALEQSKRVMIVLRGMFDHAILDLQWMSGENPAISSKGTQIKRKSKGHPTIAFDELPQFLIALETSKVRLLSKIAVKLTLMTFVRVGALAQMQWSQLDFDKRIWTIPGDASGLKRELGNSTPHLVPLTDGMIKLLKQVQRFNGHQPYVFTSVRRGVLPHIHPSSVNKTIRDMGYEGTCTAHGLRALVTTAGMEKMGYRYEVIDALLGHISKNTDKVRDAYDRAEWMDERRQFLVDWEAQLIDCGLQI